MFRAEHGPLRFNYPIASTTNEAKGFALFAVFFEFIGEITSTPRRSNSPITRLAGNVLGVPSPADNCGTLKAAMPARLAATMADEALAAARVEGGEGVLGVVGHIALLFRQIQRNFQSLIW